jgi:acyl dehydratase
VQSPSELLGLVGADLGHSSWVTVTQVDVDAFARATRAEEWIHVDPERARREGPFGTAVAHGYLTLALATRFVTELLGGTGTLVGVNYGLERVRFPHPLPVVPESAHTASCGLLGRTAAASGRSSASSTRGNDCRSRPASPMS